MTIMTQMSKKTQKMKKAVCIVNILNCFAFLKMLCLVLTNMAKTLNKLDRKIKNVEAILQEIDCGYVLFIGYSGVGKSTAISKMLLSDLQQYYENIESVTSTVCSLYH